MESVRKEERGQRAREGRCVSLVAPGDRPVAPGGSNRESDIEQNDH